MVPAYPELSPSLLTTILKAYGSLSAGSVRAIQLVEWFETPPSHHARLVLCFETGTITTAPPQVLLKAPKPHKRARGLRELRFYREVAPLMPGFPLIPCVGAAVLPPDGLPILLLADLSATHATVSRPALTWGHIETMAALLASFHAFWWAHPGLAVAADEPPITRLVAERQGIAAGAEEFLIRYGAELSPTIQRVIQHYVTDGETVLLARVAQGPLTLCHPDSHEGNVLFPREGTGATLLIDWHRYEQWWGPADLAVLVNRCVPNQWLERRDELLSHYHATLVRCGVRGYSLSDCREDYRLGVLDLLSQAIGSRDAAPWIVRHLPSILHELDALDCAGLFAVPPR